MNVQGLDLPDDFVRRMRNWARCNAGGGMDSVSAMDYGARIDGGYHEAVMPLLTGEATDTEAALATVGMRYQQAVRQFWSYEGRPWRWHGQHRGVNHETFRVWVDKGHEALRAELWRRAAVHRERAAANGRAIAMRRLNAA